MRTPVNQFIALIVTLLFLPVARAEQASLPVNSVNTGSILQMFFGLAVVVGLILGVAWFMRRMGQFQGQANSNMKVVAAMSLGQRERVLLLQVGETQLLIGTAPGSIRTLHVFDEPVISADSNTAPAGFARHLNSVLKNKASK